MPNRTLTLGQRTKDKVARDILRDEAELPPPMRGIVGLQNGGGPEGQIIFPPARTGGIGDLGRGIVGGIREFGGSIADKWRESRDAAREWGARHWSSMSPGTSIAETVEDKLYDSMRRRTAPWQVPQAARDADVKRQEVRDWKDKKYQ